ncbi:hypothetical protein ACWIGW_16335 [Nocardia brasiliensis]
MTQSGQVRALADQIRPARHAVAEDVAVLDHGREILIRELLQ